MFWWVVTPILAFYLKMSTGVPIDRISHHSEPSDSPFNTSDADLIYSVNVVNFQWTVFISDFMHMRDKTVCGF